MGILDLFLLGGPNSSDGRIPPKHKKHHTCVLYDNNKYCTTVPGKPCRFSFEFVWVWLQTSVKLFKRMVHPKITTLLFQTRLPLLWNTKGTKLLSDSRIHFNSTSFSAQWNVTAAVCFKHSAFQISQRNVKIPSSWLCCHALGFVCTELFGKGLIIWLQVLLLSPCTLALIS